MGIYYKAFLLRDVSRQECPWLSRDIPKGEELFVYESPTDGISPSGKACVFKVREPFFEMPAEALMNTFEIPLLVLEDPNDRKDLIRPGIPIIEDEREQIQTVYEGTTITGRVKRTVTDLCVEITSPVKYIRSNAPYLVQGGEQGGYDSEYGLMTAEKLLIENFKLSRAVEDNLEKIKANYRIALKLHKALDPRRKKSDLRAERNALRKLATCIPKPEYMERMRDILARKARIRGQEELIWKRFFLESFEPREVKFSEDSVVSYIQERLRLEGD